MNEILIYNHNKVVGIDDTFIFLGDFSMAFRPVELFTRRLIAKKRIIIVGNHDMCSPANKKSRNPENRAKWIQKYLDEGWDEVRTEMELDVPGIGMVNLSHLPYLGGGDSNFEDRYEDFRLPDDGRYLLHGHTHGRWIRKGRQIDVGCDPWQFFPVSLDDIIKVIKDPRDSIKDLNELGWKPDCLK